jgi:hypothetical protein
VLWSGRTTKVNDAPLILPQHLALVLLLIAGGVWWATRPKPVAVVFKEIERGLVESTIANTRAGT